MSIEVDRQNQAVGGEDAARFSRAFRSLLPEARIEAKLRIFAEEYNHQFDPARGLFQVARVICQQGDHQVIISPWVATAQGLHFIEGLDFRATVNNPSDIAGSVVPTGRAALGLLRKHRGEVRIRSDKPEEFGALVADTSLFKPENDQLRKNLTIQRGIGAGQAVAEVQLSLHTIDSDPDSITRYLSSFGELLDRLANFPRS